MLANPGYLLPFIAILAAFHVDIIEADVRHTSRITRKLYHWAKIGTPLLTWLSMIVLLGYVWYKWRPLLFISLGSITITTLWIFLIISFITFEFIPPLRRKIISRYYGEPQAEDLQSETFK